jgi:hypothetical protein
LPVEHSISMANGALRWFGAVEGTHLTSGQGYGTRAMIFF